LVKTQPTITPLLVAELLVEDERWRSASPRKES